MNNIMSFVVTDRVLRMSEIAHRVYYDCPCTNAKEAHWVDFKRDAVVAGSIFKVECTAPYGCPHKEAVQKLLNTLAHPLCIGVDAEMKLIKTAKAGQTSL